MIIVIEMIKAALGGGTEEQKDRILGEMHLKN